MSGISLTIFPSPWRNNWNYSVLEDIGMDKSDDLLLLERSSKFGMA